MLATLKEMQIRDPSKSLHNAVGENYKTQQKQDKDDETDWKALINIGESFEKHKTQLIKRL